MHTYYNINIDLYNGSVPAVLSVARRLQSRSCGLYKISSLLSENLHIC